MIKYKMLTRAKQLLCRICGLKRYVVKTTWSRFIIFVEFISKKRESKSVQMVKYNFLFNHTNIIHASQSISSLHRT